MEAPDSEQREATDSLNCSLYTVIILHIRILRGQLVDLVESLTSNSLVDGLLSYFMLSNIWEEYAHWTA